MEPPWGAEWGLTLRTCVWQRHLLSFIVCVCSVPVGSGSPARQLVHRQSTTGTFSLCAGEDRHSSTEGLKDFCFGKSELFEGKDLGLWVSGSVAWKSERREKLSGFPAVIGISLLLGKWRRGMLYSPKSVSSPHAELDAGCVTGK